MVNFEEYINKYDMNIREFDNFFIGYICEEIKNNKTSIKKLKEIVKDYEKNCIRLLESKKY